MPESNMIYARNRKELRDWFTQNNAENKLSLIVYKKHTGKPSLSHKEAMEEAICFGWIDTTVKRVDGEKYIRRFVKRTDKSRWSNNTLKYAKELIAQKKMTPHGIKRYREGLQKPVIDHGLPKNPDTPDDLINALRKNKIAQKKFSTLAPSYRRYFIYWIEKAKLPETRKKRIADVVKKLQEKKKQ